MGKGRRVLSEGPWSDTCLRLQLSLRVRSSGDLLLFSGSPGVPASSPPRSSPCPCPSLSPHSNLSHAHPRSHPAPISVLTLSQPCPLPRLSLNSSPGASLNCTVSAPLLVPFQHRPLSPVGPPVGLWPRPFGQQSCPLCQAPDWVLGTRVPSASVSGSPKAMGQGFCLLPPAFSPFLSRGSVSSKPVPPSLSSTSLPPPSPSSAQHPPQEPRPPPATQALSINNCSGPTDHSPTVGPASARQGML